MCRYLSKCLLAIQQYIYMSKCLLMVWVYLHSHMSLCHMDSLPLLLPDHKSFSLHPPLVKKLFHYCKGYRYVVPQICTLTKTKQGNEEHKLQWMLTRYWCSHQTIPPSKRILGYILPGTYELYELAVNYSITILFYLYAEHV